MIDASGDTVQSRVYPYRPIPMTDAAIRHDAEQDHERSSRPGRTPPSVDVIERALRDADCLPPTFPPVSAIVAAQDGTIWLRREEVPGDSVAWNVLDRDGRMIGALRLPSGQEVVAARGDIMAAVERDAFDVPYVVRYRLSRGTHAP